MILSHFLPRQMHNNRNQHKIIPSSFNMHNILYERYYNIGKSERYLVQTWSQTKSSRIKLPEVHGVSRNLDPNIQPEMQAIKPLKGTKILYKKPRIGQRRAGMRRRMSPINQTIAQSAELSKKISEASEI